MRRKVLEAAGDLMEACAGRPQQQAEVLRGAAGRLHDPDDAVRRAAVAAVCRLLQLHPALARSTNTDGRGPVLSLAYQRLRDKKLSVRREAASQLAALLRAWTAAAQEDPASAPEPRVMLSLPLVVCNCAVRDPELGAHVFDTVWRAGMFSAKLAPAAVARYWAQMWFQAGEHVAAGAAVGLAVSSWVHPPTPLPGHAHSTSELVPSCRRRQPAHAGPDTDGQGAHAAARAAAHLAARGGQRAAHGQHGGCRQFGRSWCSLGFDPWRRRRRKGAPACRPWGAAAGLHCGVACRPS